MCVSRQKIESEVFLLFGEIGEISDRYAELDKVRYLTTSRKENIVGGEGESLTASAVTIRGIVTIQSTPNPEQAKINETEHVEGKEAGERAGERTLASQPF